MESLTTTPTPTSATLASPRLLKRQSFTGSNTLAGPAHSPFGCEHVKDLLQNARDQATQQYALIIQALHDKTALLSHYQKSAAGSVPSLKPSYLCLQCPSVSAPEQRDKHKKDHTFSVESSNGFLHCQDCRDFVYDPTFEEIRTQHGRKKRKLSEYLDTAAALVSTNSAPRPCRATGLRGLYNMGQTCFMSVVLQSLIHNPFIRSYYLSEGHRASDCDREACTSCALDDIFVELYSAEKAEGYGAVAMLQGSWAAAGNTGLAGYQQQDAHEYLQFILNSLHSANLAETEGQKEAKAEDCECVIHQTFCGLLESTVTCSKCKNRTTAIDPFLDLSLDLRSQVTAIKKRKLAHSNGDAAAATAAGSPPLDLRDCLDRFTAMETLAAADYLCRSCDGQQNATKQLSISRLPPVLPIHFKRFSHSKSLAASSKIDTKIRFPSAMDFAPYLAPAGASSKRTNGVATDGGGAKNGGGSTTRGAVYELSSVVVHKGKMDSGHYVNYAREADEWFLFDDSKVVLVQEHEVLAAEAYMLFYVVGEFDA
ncbi:hypothetical protein LTR28_003514 [Elasticomyces elasticus]|nr:hypothetical protein LTR28_003514 [Elasticomyces elasticus]